MKCVRADFVDLNEGKSNAVDPTEGMSCKSIWLDYFDSGVDIVGPFDLKGM